MIWHWNPYALALFVSALASALVALYAWNRRSAPGAAALALLMVAAAEWSLAYGIATGFGDLTVRIFWAKIQHIGIDVVPLAMLVLALQYTGRDRWLTPRRLTLLALVPVTMLLLVWTNELHGLIWARVEVVPHQMFHWLDIEYGPFFWFHTAYSYLLLAAAGWLLLKAVLVGPHVQRRQSVTMLMGASLPWMGNFVYLTGEWNPFPYLDLTPFFYSLSGLVTAWGLFRYRLFDIVPVARDKVVESMPDPVFVLDDLGRVVDLNPAGLKLLGRSVAGVIGQPLEACLEIRQELVERYRHAVDVDEQIVIEREGEPRYYDLLISGIYGQQKDLQGRLIVLHDVTVARHAEEALRRAKEVAEESRLAAERNARAAEAANRAKSVFLTNVSHELRTPLTVILGFSSLMIRDESLSAKQRDNLETIKRSGERLMALIKDVLELSKIEAGRVSLEEVDFDLWHLLDGVRDVFAGAAEQKGLQFTCERAPNVPRYVQADAGKLRQVLINLLDDAVGFTDEGCVSLRASLAGEVPDGQAASRLVFEVEDTGAGVVADDLDSIYAIFMQVDSALEPQRGTGLGIPISRQLVRIMGGDLTVSSQGEQGILFRFELPVRVVDSAEQAGGPARRVIGLDPAGQPVADGAYRLLVVEDVQANRDLLVGLLAGLGLPEADFEIRVAGDGQEAIQMWEAWAPHLIWMDVQMPIMGGNEATQYIKGFPRGEQTTIVALAASGPEEDQARELTPGYDDVVRKPLREADVAGVLTRHLGLHFQYDDGDLF